MSCLIDKFKIPGKVIIITGGTGLIGKKHAEAVLEGDGVPVLLDLSLKVLEQAKNQFEKKYPDKKVEIYEVDITNQSTLLRVRDDLLNKYGHIDGLINNAANNPKMESQSKNMGAIQFHNFPLDIWNDDIAVGLTGAFLCAQTFGTVMEKQGNGVIINISSDYGIISPNQKIYRKEVSQRLSKL